VQILVAIVKYKTVLRKIRQGLCSRYIASLTVNTRINIHLNSSDTFYKVAKTRPQIPVIMIAAGTGVAPCRSLIWQRSALAVRELGGLIGENVLIYGGRNKLADFFFKDEWKEPILRLKVSTAFSRDQKEKIYVQDVIRKEGKRLAQLIKGQDAVVYVCGSSGNMPKAVRAALLDVLEEDVGVGSRAKVEAAFEGMEKKGLYVQETW
jgi:sulfite reductase alpha subunit-like flavoprotein